MTNPEILGALSRVQAMLRDLVSGLPPAVANRPLDPQLSCPGWQLAQAGYRETYWLREVIAGDPDLTNRVRHLNGPADLPPDQPASGLNRPAATAFAAWVASLGGGYAGAVVQHEYQWELAARIGLIADTGRAWEWCANPFHPYPDFTPFPDRETSATAFDRGEGVLRGACLHTQRCLRRASFRHHRHPEDRTGFAGLRLVYPPTP